MDAIDKETNEKMYYALMENIWERTEGDINKMTLVDKINYHLIFTDIRNQLVKYIHDYAEIIEFWADYDLIGEIDKHKAPDMSKLKGLFSKAVDNSDLSEVVKNNELWRRDI